MADNKPTTNYYKALGGENQKASMYELSVVQFLKLRNVDFDVANALQKRPGSTFASAQSLSGPVISLFEFQKLLTSGSTQSDFVLANANGNLYFNTPQATTAYTLISQNWGATQPIDFLTFGNKAWMANGTKWESFNGASIYSVGLPLSLRNASLTIGDYLFDARKLASTGGSYFLVNSATMIHGIGSGTTLIARAIYLSYSYLRNDGYEGPADFQNTARNIIYSSTTNATEFFSSSLHTRVGGFSVPPNLGITAIKIWLAEDTIYNTDTSSWEDIPGVGQLPTGQLGWLDTSAGAAFGSLTLKPTADLDRFWYFTTIPVTNLFVDSNPSLGETFYSTTFIPTGQSFAFWDGFPLPGFGFSAMSRDIYSTFTPKYIELNNNRMFSSGFSSAPSLVQFSEVGLPEIILDESNFEVRTNDGDRVMAISSYNNQLLVMKENSFHKLIGDSPDNYQLVQISDQYGCLSNRSVVQYDQKCLWLDRKGILEFNGANNTIISGAIEPVFRRMNVDAAKENAVAVHHRYRNQIWWGIPVDGSSVNNLTVVFDYLVGAWTFFDGFNPASFAWIKGALSRPTVWRGDYTGFVHYMGESFYSDSGQGISCVIGTRFEAAGENNTFIWRRFFADVATASGLTGVINGKVYSDYNLSTVQATFAMYQNQFQSRAEMGVVGKAIACELSHCSASLPLLFNGYSWTRRGLRNL